MTEQYTLNLHWGATWKLASKPKSPDGVVMSMVGWNAKADFKVNRHDVVPIVSLSSVGGGITLDDNDSEGFPVRVLLNSNQSKLLSPGNQPKTIYMDLILYDGGVPPEVIVINSLRFNILSNATEAP